MVMGQRGLVRYLSNHHQYACLWTDQKPQTFFMRKLPASAPKKVERPFVATSAVWLWDTLQAWEGYAISRHSTKSLHGALMNASIFFYKVSSRLHRKTSLWSFLPRNGIPPKAFYGPPLFRLIEIKDVWQLLSQAFFFFRKVWFFRPLK